MVQKNFEEQGCTLQEEDLAANFRTCCQTVPLCLTFQFMLLEIP